MADAKTSENPSPATPAAKAAPHLDGILSIQGESFSEKLVDAIEMLGEEKAAGFRPVGASEITAGMRYLHCSRTIHQLVTDRNRAVGIFLAVASLLITASSALYHAKPDSDLIIPASDIQRWCLPITFAILTVLAVCVAFLLIRTRAGLIYEVAKMNAMLGLPIGRVSRISPLSIFFILQAIISMAGGCCGALFSAFMIHLANPKADALVPVVLIGIAITLALMVLYLATVSYITSDRRLAQLEKQGETTTLKVAPKN